MILRLLAGCSQCDTGDAARYAALRRRCCLGSYYQYQHPTAHMSCMHVGAVAWVVVAGSD